MFSLPVVILGLAATGLSSPLAFRQKSGTAAKCPPFSGNFEITNYKLYSENSDFDSINCKFYIGANFNATVMVYDPYTKAENILTFPGISHTDPYHISGIDFDSRTGSMYFMANSGTPFVTNGKNNTGPNQMIKYDVKTNKTIYSADLNTYTSAIKDKTGLLIGGFQDMAEDTKGNSYAIASFGNGIAKVTPDGVVSAYYTPDTINTTASGINGIASFGDKLLVVDNVPAAIFTFDTTAATAVKTPVTLTKLAGSNPVNCDGVYMPPMFDNTVMLCSEDGVGIAIYKSTDGWATAKEVGLVKDDPSFAAATGLATNTVQIANSIFMNEEFFLDTGVYDVAGNRSVFPFFDITSQVMALL